MTTMVDNPYRTPGERVDDNVRPSDPCRTFSTDSVKRYVNDDFFKKVGTNSDPTANVIRLVSSPIISLLLDIRETLIMGVKAIEDRNAIEWDRYRAENHYDRTESNPERPKRRTEP